MTSVIQKAAEKKNQLAEATTPRGTLQAMIQQMQGEIAKALPSVMTPERFTRIALSTVSANPKLAECTPMSFLGAMMTAAQLGMEPNTPLGQAYLLPRYNGKTRQMECSFQLGYKGLIDLAYRSGEIASIYAYTVYANDEFSYELGLEQKLRHVPAMKDRGEPIAFYGGYKTKDGGYGFTVMSIEDVRKHAQRYSESVKKGYSSPWDSAFEEMAKKTVLKAALKYAPLKTEFARAMATDETAKDVVSKDIMDEPSIVWADGTVDDAPPGEEDAVANKQG